VEVNVSRFNRQLISPSRKEMTGAESLLELLVSGVMDSKNADARRELELALEKAFLAVGDVRTPSPTPPPRSTA